MNHYLFYSDNDKLSLSGWGTFPLGTSPWPSDRDSLPGLSLQPRLAGQKKGVWQTMLFSLLLNWGRGTPRGEGSGLNTQGKVMTGWGATEVPILRHFDHRTILEQKFVKLTVLYPGVVGLGNNFTQVKLAFLMFTNHAWWLQEQLQTPLFQSIGAPSRSFHFQHAEQPKLKEHWRVQHSKKSTPNLCGAIASGIL